MKPDEINSLDWDKTSGLLPAIVQDADSGAVLMLGYMNRDALERTLATELVTFFSRSRMALWVKGATSGNTLSALTITSDCDRDAILVQAKPTGPVCHAGTASCFPGAQSLPAMEFGFLTKLEAVITERLNRPSDSSYTTKLHAEGLRRVAQKVGEEGLELALAAAGGSDAEVVAEGADLFYHVALVLKERGLSLAAIVEELARRHEERRGLPRE